jgi:hypothetical protein
MVQQRVRSDTDLTADIKLVVHMRFLAFYASTLYRSSVQTLANPAHFTISSFKL